MARIMVVDDEEAVREILRAMLERESHSVVEAENGKVALDRLQEEQADVVVADLFMPEMDGLQLITKLREESPETKVVAISGSVYERRHRFLEIAGRMDSVRTLAKPFTAQEVQEVVREVLEDKGADESEERESFDQKSRAIPRPNLPFCQTS